MKVSPMFFKSGHMFRKWLEAHHCNKSELLVGFYKIASGKPSMTWPESVDEALCFGWIDSVRKTIDSESYSIRFTKRRPNSIWSNVNVAKVESLIAAGRMTEAGLERFAARRVDKTGVYSFEQKGIELDAASQAVFKENLAAWEFFEAQSAAYRKKAVWWVSSAKRPSTRSARLQALIEASMAKTKAPSLL